jgi:hypothetical protein
MCNIVGIAVAIFAAQAAVLASLTALGIAILLSAATFLTAWTSTGPMIAAGIALGVAVVSLFAANYLVGTCVGGSCPTQVLRTALTALMAVLGLQAIAIGIGVAGAALPFWAAVAGISVFVAIVAQAALWGVLAFGFDALATCQATPTEPKSPLVTLVWIISAVLAALTLAVVFGLSRPP